MAKTESTEQVTSLRYLIQCLVNIGPEMRWIDMPGKNNEQQAIDDAKGFKLHRPTRVIDTLKHRIIWGEGKGSKWRPARGE